MRSGMDYTIVRPTAYFWVFDSQTKNIRNGKPGFLIGTGDQAVHNPISREDLAEYMVGSIGSSERMNRIHIIGGPESPDNIVTYKDSLLMVFESMDKEPKLISVPCWLFRTVIQVTRFIGLFSRKAGVFSEFLKITYYYSTNDMRAPGYGSMTIRQHMLDTTRKVET